MPRFIVLEHTDAPDDPGGRHYDLLLEAGEVCRTWRLSDMPAADGKPVAATPIAPHRLAWLDHHDGPVSGTRGHARRIDAGTYEPACDAVAEMTVDETTEPVVVQVRGTLLIGELTVGHDRAWRRP